MRWWRRDVVETLIILALAATALGLVSAGWALTGHWHAAVAGQVNLGRVGDAWAPSWVFNIGFPTVVLWCLLGGAWVRWLNREKVLPSGNPRPQPGASESDRVDDPDRQPDVRYEPDVRRFDPRPPVL